MPAIGCTLYTPLTSLSHLDAHTLLQTRLFLLACNLDGFDLITDDLVWKDCRAGFGTVSDKFKPEAGGDAMTAESGAELMHGSPSQSRSGSQERLLPDDRHRPVRPDVRRIGRIFDKRLKIRTMTVNRMATTSASKYDCIIS